LLGQAIPSIFAKFNTTLFYFQQDGAPAHRANTTIDFLAQHSITVIPQEDWPPYSPDLSPIENLWGIMADKVRACAPELCEKLINSIPTRLQIFTLHRLCCVLLREKQISKFIGHPVDIFFTNLLSSSSLDSCWAMLSNSASALFVKE